MVSPWIPFAQILVSILTNVKPTVIEVSAKKPLPFGSSLRTKQDKDQ
jgi:hypothetical protein